MDWHPRCTSHPLKLDILTLRRSLARGGNSGVGTWREKELKKVDRELARGNNKAAVKIVKRMQGKPGGLRGFGAAKQVPCAKSSVDHVEYFDGVDMSYIQPRVDSMLELVIKNIQSALHEEVRSTHSLEQKSITASVPLSWELQQRSQQHEAGHFIVAYLLGVLPRAYQVPSLFAKEEKPNRGLVKMVDFASPLQGNNHKMWAKSLNKFSCIALGGLAAAYLEYGYTGGFVSDIDKLYIALNWLEFTESEAEAYLRWAILNTTQLLLRHRIATLKLADTMALGRSIGYCIATIEDSLSQQL